LSLNTFNPHGATGLGTRSKTASESCLDSYVKLQNAIACVDSAEHALHEAGTVDPSVLAHLLSIRQSAEIAMAHIEDLHNALFDREVA
jgi:hypothetical protein